MATDRLTLAYIVCTLPIMAGVLLMGIDNHHRLQGCELTGRSAAECRLVILGR
jgi:hypothetical protein